MDLRGEQRVEDQHGPVLRKPRPCPDLFVLGTDVVYSEASVEPLLVTMKALASCGRASGFSVTFCLAINTRPQTETNSAAISSFRQKLGSINWASLMGTERGLSFLSEVDQEDFRRRFPHDVKKAENIETLWLRGS